MFNTSTRNLQPVLLAIILTACPAAPVARAAGSEEVSAVQVAAVEYPKEINVRQAREKLNDGAFFLDVRESLEWDVMRIPGAVLIPLNQLQNRLSEIPKDGEIVVVCASGSRSKMALDILRKAGLEKSSSMSGGIQLWRQLGYPIETGE